MKIGKNLHIGNRKKTYRKPVLEVLFVDREISLLMNTGTGPPPGPTGVQSVDLNESTNTIYDETQQYPKDNPFGGGTPTYER
jgi:hypothetical protein